MKHLLDCVGVTAVCLLKRAPKPTEGTAAGQRPGSSVLHPGPPLGEDREGLSPVPRIPSGPRPVRGLLQRPHQRSGGRGCWRHADVRLQAERGAPRQGVCAASLRRRRLLGFVVLPQQFGAETWVRWSVTTVITQRREKSSVYAYFGCVLSRYILEKVY